MIPWQFFICLSFLKCSLKEKKMVYQVIKDHPAKEEPPSEKEPDSITFHLPAPPPKISEKKRKKEILITALSSLILERNYWINFNFSILPLYCLLKTSNISKSSIKESLPCSYPLTYDRMALEESAYKLRFLLKLRYKIENTQRWTFSQVQLRILDFYYL